MKASTKNKRNPRHLLILGFLLVFASCSTRSFGKNELIVDSGKTSPFHVVAAYPGTNLFAYMGEVPLKVAILKYGQVVQLKATEGKYCKVARFDLFGYVKCSDLQSESEFETTNLKPKSADIIGYWLNPPTHGPQTEMIFREDGTFNFLGYLSTRFSASGKWTYETSTQLITLTFDENGQPLLDEISRILPKMGKKEMAESGIHSVNLGKRTVTMYFKSEDYSKGGVEYRGIKTTIRNAEATHEIGRYIMFFGPYLRKEFSWSQ